MSKINGLSGPAEAANPPNPQAQRFIDFVASTAESQANRLNRLIQNDHVSQQNAVAQNVHADIRNGAAQVAAQAETAWNDAAVAQQRAIEFITKTAEVTAGRLALANRSELDSEKIAAMQDAAAELRRKLPR
jgi:hypothetical protein